MNDADVYIRPGANRKLFIECLYTSLGTLEVKNGQMKKAECCVTTNRKGQRDIKGMQVRMMSSYESTDSILFFFFVSFLGFILVFLLSHTV